AFLRVISHIGDDRGGADYARALRKFVGGAVRHTAAAGREAVAAGCSGRPSPGGRPALYRRQSWSSLVGSAVSVPRLRPSAVGAAGFARADWLGADHPLRRRAGLVGSGSGWVERLVLPAGASGPPGSATAVFRHPGGARLGGAGPAAGAGA